MKLVICHGCSLLQLAAGSEHIINGRTVRINLAGPRPDQMQQQLGLLQNDFLPQLQNVAWPGRQQQQQQQQQAVQPQQGAGWPVSPGKMASGVLSQCMVASKLVTAMCGRSLVVARALWLPEHTDACAQEKLKVARVVLTRAGGLAYM